MSSLSVAPRALRAAILPLLARGGLRRVGIAAASGRGHANDHCDADDDTCFTKPAPLAPLAPTTSAGDRLQWCLSQAGSSGAAGVQQEFLVLLAAHLEVVAADEEAEHLLRRMRPPPMAPADDDLRLRLMALRRRQRSASTQDALYALVLSKFVSAGVPMTPPLQGCSSSVPCPQALTGLLLAFHGTEAADVVHAHVVAAIDGRDAASAALPAAEVVRVSTAQLAQARAAAGGAASSACLQSSHAS
jgi:hypothetical protein